MLTDLSRAGVAASLALVLLCTSASPAVAKPSVRESSRFGEWIADIERPTEQYRRP